MTKDTVNLRHDTDYNLEVYPNVYWVPANCLGQTRYTNDGILKLMLLTPEEKVESINSLYEALQLYQASKFRGFSDSAFKINNSTALVPDWSLLPSFNFEAIYNPSPN